MRFVMAALVVTSAFVLVAQPGFVVSAQSATNTSSSSSSKNYTTDPYEANFTPKPELTYGNATTPWKITLLDPPVGRGYNQSALFVQSDIAWRPQGAESPASGDVLDGRYALVIGGMRGSDPTHICNGWSFVMATNGSAYRVLLSHPGCMLVAVGWSPDGTTAIVIGEHNVILKWDAVNRAWTDVWGNSPYASQDFYGRHVAWNPNGTFAVITGSDLLYYYPTFTTAAGVKLHDVLTLAAQKNTQTPEFYDAIAWSPDSKYALISMGITNSTGTRELGVIAFLSYDSTMCQKHKAGNAPCIYTSTFYGKYDPGFTDVNGITFGPLGQVAWIYGYDYGQGDLMEYDQSSDSFNYPGLWTNSAGRITDMAWEPNAYRVLYTSESNNQLESSYSWLFSPVLNNTICGEAFPTLMREKNGLGQEIGICPNIERVAWDPSGKFALAIGDIGWLFKIEPTSRPTVTITNPVDNERFGATAQISVTGRASVTLETDHVTNASFQVDNGTWQKGNLSVSTYTGIHFTLNGSQLAPGLLHTLLVHASSNGGATWGENSSVSFYIFDPNHQYPSPHLTAVNGNVVQNGFNLSWTNMPGAYYELQSATDPTFASYSNRTVYGNTFNMLVSPRGTYYFRVIAEGGMLDSNPSNVVSVQVTSGIQGMTDAQQSALLKTNISNLVGGPHINTTPDTTTKNTKPPSTNTSTKSKFFLPAPSGGLTLATLGVAAAGFAGRRRR
ncbi:MAG: Ig-like domain-containing protein [Thermoplasmatota archaeon]